MSIAGTETEVGTEARKGGRVSVRLREDLEPRLEKVRKASKRSTTSLIEEALEKVLPALERRYRKAA